MKKIIKTLFFICLLSIFGLCAVSCSKNTVREARPHKRETAEKPVPLSDEQPMFFRMPSLQQLAEKSPLLRTEAFGDANAEVKYIVGDLLILSAQKKLVYLNLLPKTSEDDYVYITLIIQDKNTNVPTVFKEWPINNENGQPVVLQEFYEAVKEEITGILTKEKIALLDQHLSLLPVKKGAGKLQNTYETDDTGLQLLTKVYLDVTNRKAIVLDHNSNNPFCSECDPLKIYKTDFLGEIVNHDKTIRLFALGFLEQIDQAPSALHVRLISAE